MSLNHPINIVRPLSKQPIPPHAKKVFGGVLFDVYQWEQKLFDGSTATFEKLKRHDTVVIYPILNDGKILLTEQSQPGKEKFIGAAGGRVEPGEDILCAAKRELLEETGYTAQEFILWNAQQPASKIEWAVYTFIAKGITKASESNPDAGEKITLKPVTFDELLDVATLDCFVEKEMLSSFFEAKLHPEKKVDLKKLFAP